MISLPLECFFPDRLDVIRREEEKAKQLKREEKKRRHEEQKLKNKLSTKEDQSTDSKGFFSICLKN